MAVLRVGKPASKLLSEYRKHREITMAVAKKSAKAPAVQSRNDELIGVRSISMRYA